MFRKSASKDPGASEMKDWLWSVENFQIPSPLGDCSVHVLKNKGKVISAFLMDGGDTADSTRLGETIIERLEVIEKELSLDGKPLKLNA
jgi:hypothetical protein